MIDKSKQSTMSPASSYALSLLLVGACVLVACGVDSTIIGGKAELKGESGERIELEFSQRKKNLDLGDNNRVNDLILGCSITVEKFINLVGSKTFTRTEMAKRSALEGFKHSMIEQTKMKAAIKDREEQEQIKRVISYFKDALQSSLSKINPDDAKTDERHGSQFLHYGQLLRKMFSRKIRPNYEYLTLNKVEHEWLVDFKSIKINGLPLSEIIEILVAKLIRMKLSWVVEGLIDGLSELQK